MCDVTLESYDIIADQRVEDLFQIAHEAGKDVEYIVTDVVQTQITETDLLFIDTWHLQAQLRQELSLHGNLAQKFLIFHDTHTFGTVDESLEFPSNGNRSAI